MFIVCTYATAITPNWVGKTPKELNRTYKFVEIVSTGMNISNARIDAMQLLAQDVQLANAVNVSVESGLLTRTSETMTSDGTNSSLTENAEVYVKVSGQTYKLQAVRVDEYVAKQRGMVKLHTLFMVALCDNPVFDRTYLTTSYGFAPVALSVIPGCGQWYKGSKAKGIILFAAEAASVASILVFENQRASYIKKMKEQPRHAKTYNSKADNSETARNISIGVAAGVWVYNIIDAAVAKGARRVKVKPAGGGGFSFNPVVTPYSAGISLAYQF